MCRSLDSPIDRCLGCYLAWWLGLFFGLMYGGIACFQHVLLRLILWRGGAIPWRHADFLDYCAGHILLYRVGGGYMFVHRLVLEYFASPDTSHP